MKLWRYIIVPRLLQKQLRLHNPGQFAFICGPVPLFLFRTLFVWDVSLLGMLGPTVLRLGRG
jgi:hypothetical protein